MDILTVGQLREALAQLPDDLAIGFSVYGHTWFAPAHRSSTGPVTLTETTLHYAGGATQAIAIIHQGRLRRDGYLEDPASTSS